MPPRQSRVSAPHASRSSKPSGSTSSSSYHKGNKKRKSRGLDALNIAEHTHTDRTKVKQYRLGEVEGEEPRSKKRRLQDDDEDDDAPQASNPRRLQQKAVRKGGLDSAVDGEVGGEHGQESGSDSEGGRWKVGVDDEGDDSDIDSDEAFGSGDEERFEGFTFRGSGKNKPGAKATKRANDVDAFDLNEENGEAAEDEDEDEDSNFGGEGVDLATMLDDDGDSEEEFGTQKGDARGTPRKEAPVAEDDDEMDEDIFEDEEDDDEAPSEYSDEDKEDKFEMSDDEESAGEDRTRNQQLQDLVKSSAAPATQGDTPQPSDRSAMLARALAALNSSSGMDPALSREAQKLGRSIQPSAKDGKKSKLVSVPLPKRQQDQIDRAAARQETNKTLDRWVDTVKHNRRAEHLTFPLADPHAQDPQGKTQLTATTAEKPRSELERSIAAIMKESGLGPAGGQAAEKQLEGFEELQTNRMPLEEVQARRAELRRQRELMFREEIKARRIKKIKSKAYRRVHRRDAQKQAQKERDLLVAAGIEGSEDEREANDKRRAEERMGARHRESKWAKSVKATGRAAWDDEARDGVTEMARRNEDLRRRQEGRGEEADGFESDVESSEDEYDGGEDVEESRLQRQLERVEGGADGETSKLSNLKFMQRADAARQQRNAQDMAELRKDLGGAQDDQDSEEESLPDTTAGRKIFGPTEKKLEAPEPQAKRAEFEEGQSSDDDENDSAQLLAGSEDTGAERTIGSVESQPTNLPKAGLSKPTAPAKTFKPGKAAGAKQVNGLNTPIEASPPPRPQAEIKAPNTNGWTTVNFPNGTHQKDQDHDDDDEPASDAELNTDAAEPSNWDLVQAAFGGDDVEKAFQDEKASAASSEDEKFEDNTLPGWGSWTGTGVSKKAIKRDQQRKKGRFITKVAEGVKASDRKDAAMPRVIISEKRQKKNAKYLANQLPHPYESRTQYERGLRQPVGPEWTTKRTFQDATKPRVLAKPGRAIEPMSAPML